MKRFLHFGIRRSAITTSPVRLFVLIIVTIVLSEALIMFLIGLMKPMSFWKTAMVDSLLLLVIMFPLLYFMLFRPLIKQIQERKLTEYALRKSEERYRSIFENVQDVYYEVTVEGKILELSPSVKYLFKGQYQRMDLMGTAIEAIYANKSDRQILLNVMYEQGSVIDYEVLLKNRDGLVIPCSISAKLIRNEKGEPEKTIGSIRDISKRKQAEEEIKLKNEQLHALNAEKDKFFSIIAHDLRSPFNAFLGITELMSDSESALTPDEFRKFAASMHGSAANLYQLLENLLEWSVIKQNIMPFKPESVNLFQLTKECAESLKEVAENKLIVLKNQIPPETLVFADRRMILSVFRNLITNALKFTPKSGMVTLSAIPSENNRVKVSVADTGIGMDAAMVSNLFRSDVKINRSGTEGEPSTGLGLLLCNEFIQKHGGELFAESRTGQGSTFYFTLKRADQALLT